jgi:hypothetical protein
MTFLTELQKKINFKKFIWQHERPQKVKAILSKKSNAGAITIPDFKLHYRASAIKAAWHQHKNRHEGQWDRIKDPDTHPHSDSRFLTKEPKAYNGEKTVSSTNVAGKTGYLHVED